MEVTRLGHPILATVPLPKMGDSTMTLDADVVLCLLTDSGHQFATWQRNVVSGDTYWGHYFNDLYDALADLYERAKKPDPRFDLTVKGAMARYMAEHNDIGTLEQLVDEGMMELMPDSPPPVDDEWPEWIAEYPNFSEQIDGWVHPVDGGGTVLVTRDDAMYYVGQYDAEGEEQGVFGADDPDDAHKLVEWMLGFRPDAAGVPSYDESVSR